MVSDLSCHVHVSPSLNSCKSAATCQEAITLLEDLYSKGGNGQCLDILAAANVWLYIVQSVDPITVSKIS